MLGQPPYSIVVDTGLKSILSMLGYNSLSLFSNFSSEDTSKLEDFMRKKFPLILRKKCEKLNISYDQELKSYYGDLWMYCPEQYSLLGGQLRTIEAISNLAKNPKPAVQVKQPSSRPAPSACKRKKTSPSGEENLQERVLELKSNLDKVMKAWLSKQSSSSSDELPELCSRVVANNLGSFTAEVKCPFLLGGKNCAYSCTLHHKDGKWYTSNLYRHIETQHLKSKVKKLEKKRNTLVEMFAASPQNKSKQLTLFSSSDSSNEDIGSAEAIECEVDVHQIDEDSNDFNSPPKKSKPVISDLDDDIDSVHQIDEDSNDFTIPPKKRKPVIGDSDDDNDSETDEATVDAQKGVHFLCQGK